MLLEPRISINSIKNYTYAQLVAERNDVLRQIMEYEEYLKSGLYVGEMIGPNPFVRYQMNQEYLKEILALMKEKIGLAEQEIDLITTATDEEQLEYISNVFYATQEYVPDWMINRAKKLLKKLVDQENAGAINLLGALYYEGKGYKKNQKKAVELYIKAAELGNSIAMSNLGYAYMYGNGTEINFEQSYKYFSMAVQRGECDAMNKLGDMYKDGIYVPKDELMALYLFYKCLEEVPHDASNDAYPGALRRIGECFLKGIGIEADIEKAKQMLTDAVEIYELQIENGNYYAGLSIKKAKELLAETDRM